MKATTAFAAFAANRTATNRATKPFAVVPLTKAGNPSKARPSDLCIAATPEEAQRILTRLQGYNPDTTWVIVEN